VSLATIVRNGKGRAGHWRIIPAESVVGSEDLDACALYHYGTCMLAWRRCDNRVLYLSTGWGSASDQNGMNVALRVLGGWAPERWTNHRPIPQPGTPGPAFYYSRAGGARFAILDARYSLHPTRGGAWQPKLAELAVAP